MNTILILEDDQNLNRGISLKLRREGYDVLSAFTVRDARRLFDEHQPESQRIPTFYPSAEDVLNSIVPNYFLGIIYGCLAESYYSEHNARMMAMQNATDSAKDMLDELSMTYNRVRQADITQELTEVCAGAKAQQRK